MGFNIPRILTMGSKNSCTMETGRRDRGVFKYQKPEKVGRPPTSKMGDVLAELKRLNFQKLGFVAWLASGIGAHFLYVVYTLLVVSNYSLGDWTWFWFNCSLVAGVILWKLDKSEGSTLRYYHHRNWGHLWTLCFTASTIGITVSLGLIVFEVFFIWTSLEILLGWIFLFPFCLIGVILLDVIEYHWGQEDGKFRLRALELLERFQRFTSIR